MQANPGMEHLGGVIGRLHLSHALPNNSRVLQPSTATHFPYPGYKACTCVKQPMLFEAVCIVFDFLSCVWSSCFGSCVGSCVGSCFRQTRVTSNVRKTFVVILIANIARQSLSQNHYPLSSYTYTRPLQRASNSFITKS